MIEKLTISDIELPDNLVHVEGGTFQMGNNNGFDSEKPIHQVTLSDFYISKYPITVKQYRLFCKETHKKMPKEPSWGWKNDHPIVNVSWEDAKAYCEWKNSRLPTEAEWEFAARGGNKSIGYKYSGSDKAKEVAWYKDNIDSKKYIKTYIVGNKAANELNLYDMSGNVWEWCIDLYGDYCGESQNNPQSSTEGNERVQRGGGWSSGDYQLRVTNRRGEKPSCHSNHIGFRLVKVKDIIIPPPPPIPPEPIPEQQIADLKKQIDGIEEQLPDDKLTPPENLIIEFKQQLNLLLQRISDLEKLVAEIEKPLPPSRLNELKQLGTLCNHKRFLLEKQSILENRVDEKFRLKSLIEETNSECQKIEQEMSELETQL